MRYFSRACLSRLLASLMVFLAGGSAPSSNACTTFNIPQSELKLVGKSYDWELGGEGLVFVNKRHVAKRALDFFPTDVAAQWSSKFGSVTFTQYGREFPLGGMNEKGLVVESMWLETSVYPPPDGKASINELQWIQYQLDNFATVDELVKAVPRLRISRVYGLVHYLACDRFGLCATIEFLNGKPVIHDGKQMFVNVLTNSSYEDSVRYLRQHVGFGGDKEIPAGTESMQRFARAAAGARAYTAREELLALSFAFGILNDVFVDGTSRWNIVYESSGKQIAFRTTRGAEIRRMDVSKLDYSCRTPVRTLDVEVKEAGDVSARFVDYTREANRALIERGLHELIPYLPEGTLDRLTDYPATTRCLETR